MEDNKIPLPKELKGIEIWGQSPFNGVWFPVRVWPTSALTAFEAWDQLELRLICTGQPFQLDATEPSECRVSTPQALDPMQDLNARTGGMPGRGVVNVNVTATVLPATGQENSD